MDTKNTDTIRMNNDMYTQMPKSYFLKIKVLVKKNTQVKSGQ